MKLNFKMPYVFMLFNFVYNVLLSDHHNWIGFKFDTTI